MKEILLEYAIPAIALLAFYLSMNERVNRRKRTKVNELPKYENPPPIPPKGINKPNRDRTTTPPGNESKGLTFKEMRDYIKHTELTGLKPHRPKYTPLFLKQTFTRIHYRNITSKLDSTREMQIYQLFEDLEMFIHKQNKPIQSKFQQSIYSPVPSVGYKDITEEHNKAIEEAEKLNMIDYPCSNCQHRIILIGSDHEQYYQSDGKPISYCKETNTVLNTFIYNCTSHLKY